MLDFSSLLFSLAMVASIMSGLLITFWFSKTQAAGLKEMAGSAGASAIGALLTALAHSAPNFDLFYYGISFFVISIMFAARSMRRLQGHQPLYSAEAIVFIVAASYCYYFAVVETNIFSLAFANALLFSLIGGLTAKNLLTEKRPELVQACKILGFIFLGFTLFQLLKLTLRPFIEALPSISAQTVIIDYIDVFVAMATAIGWGVGLIWASYKQSEIRLLTAIAIAEQQARTDMLTGLNNRRAFFEYANVIDSQAKLQHHCYVVAMIDLDHFKYVNDTWGHDIGDVTLQKVAQLIPKTLREHDIVGRIGGEEFAVIMPETSVSEGTHIAEGIRKSIEQHVIQTPKTDINVTISIGLAALQDHSLPLREIVSNADTALYQAKSEGRNQVRIRAD